MSAGSQPGQTNDIAGFHPAGDDAVHDRIPGSGLPILSGPATHPMVKSLPWWGRRLITVPVVLISSALALLLSPVLFVAALLVDGWRVVRSGATPVAWRLVAILLAYLAGEVFAVVGALLLWLLSGFGTARARLVRMSYKLQLGWGNLLWESARLIFRLRLETEGLELARPGPILILSRHASIIDNVLPFQLFSRAHRMTLRYVIKKELLMDPALDIAGSWLPNHFVDRASKDPEAELKALRRLGSGLTDNDGLLIFPEGTRFTEVKQQRALASLAKRNPRFHRQVSGLRHLMPPHPGGALALLEASSADVVLLAHHGFDGFAQIRDIWSGGMVGKLVRVKLTRIPFTEIPEGRGHRTEWLFKVWQGMDDWLSGLEPHRAPTDG
jgi:1-acyl-sn-glycerol-3-phosphate acyltransferase